MNYEEIFDQIEQGELRAVRKTDSDNYEVNTLVKEAILAAFKEGRSINTPAPYLGFVDKHNIPAREFSVEDQVRIVPGGSSVRRGSYIAKGVIMMPPSYVNIGAYVDEGCMIDSHVLVGSCAQVGKNVHLSAGVQIGGVLEPIGQVPVVIEDDVFIGAGAVIVEGIQVSSSAVIAPGVILSASVPVYDCVNEVVLEKAAAIPSGAVVVPGTRPVSSSWGRENALSMSCPLIVKYRDEKSNASLSLEELLR